LAFLWKNDVVVLKIPRVVLSAKSETTPPRTEVMILKNILAQQIGDFFKLKNQLPWHHLQRMQFPIHGSS
jgi:hypothetical protein